MSHLHSLATVISAYMLQQCARQNIALQRVPCQHCLQMTPIREAWVHYKPIYTNVLENTFSAFPVTHNSPRDGFANVGCSPSSALLFLPHLEAVLQHRQAATREVATHCGVSENVAALLLDHYQGNTRAACKAWAGSPTGNGAFVVPCLCLPSVLASLSSSSLPVHTINRSGAYTT